MPLQFDKIVNPKDTYVITVGFAHGDGDAYTTKTVELAGKSFNRLQVEEIIRRFDEVYDLITCEDDIYSEEELAADPDLDNYEIYIHGVRIPRTGDSTCDGERDANGGIDSFIYYDSDGLAFDVTTID